MRGKSGNIPGDETQVTLPKGIIRLSRRHCGLDAEKRQTAQAARTRLQRATKVYP